MCSRWWREGLRATGSAAEGIWDAGWGPPHPGFHPWASSLLSSGLQKPWVRTAASGLGLPGKMLQLSRKGGRRRCGCCLGSPAWGKVFATLRHVARVGSPCCYLSECCDFCLDSSLPESWRRAKPKQSKRFTSDPQKVTNSLILKKVNLLSKEAFLEIIWRDTRKTRVAPWSSPISFPTPSLSSGPSQGAPRLSLSLCTQPFPWPG